MVALRHMMSPLAGMKQKQNQNLGAYTHIDMQNKKISNDQELIQSDPISCPQNQKGNN